MLVSCIKAICSVWGVPASPHENKQQEQSRRTGSALLCLGYLLWGKKTTPNNSEKALHWKGPCKKWLQVLQKGCSSSAISCDPFSQPFSLPFPFHDHSCTHLYPLSQGDFRAVSVGMWVFSAWGFILASPPQYLYQNYAQSSLIWSLSFLWENSSERLRFSFLLPRFLHGCGKERTVLGVALVLLFNIAFVYGVTCYLWVYGFQFSFLYLQSLVGVDVTCVKNWNRGCALKTLPSFLTTATLIKMKINIQAEKCDLRMCIIQRNPFIFFQMRL